MISVEEALEKVLGQVDVLAPENKPILDCLGQVLAEDVRAGFNVPPADNSAMDGFAVKAENIAGASPQQPQTLRVIGEVQAGSVFDREVTTGTAVRIMTGAPVPPGADTVVPFEQTDETRRHGADLSEIGILKDVARGSNIRLAGEDIRAGALVLTKGKDIRPADIGVMASLGKPRANVHRRPLVGILATGNEITDPSQPLGAGKIYNTNSWSIAAETLRYGGVPRLLGIAEDRVEPLVAALRRGLDCDLLITTGGVSLGDYDLVKNVLAREGEVTFWTVRMKPGKPLAFGSFQGNGGKRVPHLGLPGNPVSAMVSFELFARPAILKMLGKRMLSKPSIRAVLEIPIRNTDGRRVFARVAVKRRGDRYYASPTGEQGSGILMSMALADGLAVVPEEVKQAREGDVVEVLMLNWDETCLTN